jgi:hypothetical protein
MSLLWEVARDRQPVAITDRVAPDYHRVENRDRARRFALAEVKMRLTLPAVALSPACGG